MKKIVLFLCKKNFVVIFLCLVFCFGCGAVKDCDEIGNDFFNSLKLRDYDKALSLVDEEAFKYTDKEKWLQGLEHKEENFGLPLSFKRIDFETITQNRVTRVGIKYRVIYVGAELFEKLEFIQRDNQYKITFYQFNSDSTLVY